MKCSGHEKFAKSQPTLLIKGLYLKCDKNALQVLKIQIVQHTTSLIRAIGSVEYSTTKQTYSFNIAQCRQNNGNKLRNTSMELEYRPYLLIVLMEPVVNTSPCSRTQSPAKVLTSDLLATYSHFLLSASRSVSSVVFYCYCYSTFLRVVSQVVWILHQRDLQR